MRLLYLAVGLTILVPGLASAQLCLKSLLLILTRLQPGVVESLVGNRFNGFAWAKGGKPLKWFSCHSCFVHQAKAW